MGHEVLALQAALLEKQLGTIAPLASKQKEKKVGLWQVEELLKVDDVRRT
jgi:hypothetical protein